MSTESGPLNVPDPLIPRPFENRPEPNSAAVSQVLFRQLGEYARLEHEEASADLSVLQKLNDIAIEKYHGMVSQSQVLAKGLSDVQKKYIELIPYFSRIDEVERGTSDLEKAVYVLDEYSRQLERKFTQLFTNIYQSDRALSKTAVGHPASSSSSTVPELSTSITK
eukprot:ANDGO_07172.mRNA.1 Biogenesis of lysosome-related organelles complex 1 subunit 2